MALEFTLAVALYPNAVAFSSALDSLPIALELSPFVFAWKPIDTEFSFAVLDSLPIETEFFSIVFALLPSATDANSFVEES